MTDLFAALDRVEARLQRRHDDLHRKVDAQSRAILLLIQHITAKGDAMSIIDEIESDLSALETKAETVVANLKAKFDRDASAISGFKTRIAALVTTIEGLEETIAADVSGVVAQPATKDQHAA